MWKAHFQFEGGSVTKNRSQYKFHCFVVNSDKTEHFLYSAIKKGLASKVNILIMGDVFHRGTDWWSGYDPNKVVYRSVVPILKLFTATQGFGTAKEYFSYFIALDPNSDKSLTIKPLGYKEMGEDWFFSAPGRFMSDSEIRAFFGTDSQTYKFYRRQSFISKSRLLDMVKIRSRDVVEVPEEEEETRYLRIEE